MDLIEIVRRHQRRADRKLERPANDPSQWPADWREMWDERVAIMTIDGGVHEDDAPREATREIVARMSCTTTD